MSPIIKQISKFIVVGVVNTGIDFAILNALMFSMKIYSGKWLILFNSISFTAAVINSYFMNKYWTFKAQNTEDSKAKQFSQFLIISVIGISINDAIVYALATFTSPLFGLSAQMWTNAAKIIATLASMAWNFIGYKFIVFKPKTLDI
ncbi:MAG: GtrA family protein [Patescibacteria group bacterium]|nr:GtrA family protein [Patescibacteria group bacterium]